MQVPATAAMAVQLRSVAKHEEDERAEIKRLVLKANKDLDLAGSAGPHTQIQAYRNFMAYMSCRLRPGHTVALNLGQVCVRTLN